MADTTGPRSTARRWLLAAVIVLAIPVIAFGIGAAVVSKYHADLVDYAQTELGRTLSAEEQALLDLDTICAEPEFATDDVCGDVRLAAVTRQLAIVGAVVGIGLLLIVGILGARASRDRDALLQLFRPGLYLTLAGLVVAVAIDGALAVSGVYLGIGVFAGRIFPVILLGLAAGGVLGVVAIIRAASAATKRGVSQSLGRRVDPAREPRLAGLVADLAREVGTAPPDNIVVGLDANFFVTEVDVVTPEGRYAGRSLFLSLPLSRILTEPELRAVLGHELGHFHGSDTVYSQRFYPIYAGAIGAIQNLGAASAGSALRSIVLYPAALILGLFLDGFGTTERALSRDRELAADQVGASVATARDIGTSLVKLAAFSPALGTALEAMADAARRRRRGPTALGASFLDYARVAAAGDPFAELDTHEIPHPTDSHPPLSERLAALGLTLDELRADAAVLEPAPSAAALVVDGELIETQLTEWLRGRLDAAFANLPVPVDEAAGPG